KDILPFFLPADILPGKIFADGLPLMEDNVPRAGVLQGFGQSKLNGFILGFGQFGLKGPEELVPDDEEHPHVPVEVFAIGGVVYTVMRWGDQDIFEPTHFVDQFGVDKDAPDLGRGIHEEDIQRPEAEECQRYKINKTVKRLEDRRPETYRKIEVFRRVMRDMYRPEKADLMVPAVQPVIEEILTEQQQQPIGEHARDRKPVMLVAGTEHQERNGAEKQVNAAIEQHQVDIRERIFPGVCFAGVRMMMMAIIAEQDLHTDNDEVDRRADEDQYLFSEAFHGLKINQITHLCSSVLSREC